MTTRRLIILDLETVPAPWAPAPEQVEFPELPAHLPVVIGALWVVLRPGQPAVIEDQTTMGDPGADWERPALVALGENIKGATGLVTFNGRGFDMPLLQMRALALKVPWEFWPDKEHRFPNYKTPLFHMDLQDLLGGYGATKHLSLDGLAKMCGILGKGDMHGSKVKDMWADGEHERVRLYCLSDLRTTLTLYLRFLFMRGHAVGGDTGQWIADVGSWWESVEAETKRESE